uniref:Uncharacterized protein n=1 Tax=Grammatophora oceanica TaxID=210454 RepID=A0A7S1V1Y2_9STRA
MAYASCECEFFPAVEPPTRCFAITDSVTAHLSKLLFRSTACEAPLPNLPPHILRTHSSAPLHPNLRTSYELPHLLRTHASAPPRYLGTYLVRTPAPIATVNLNLVCTSDGEI